MRKNLPAIQNRRPDSVLGNTERTMYEALCRKEVPVSQKDISRLYCYYKRDRPFLVYAPIKVEIKRFNPLAVLFKDVISDDEVATIQELAKPKLARATVHDSATGKLVTATYRISKSAWLKEWEHEVVERVNKRIELMTNLEMETAEELQIANYGIGGHYDPHFDHAKKEESKSFESLGTGNRIATVLFYVSSLHSDLIHNSINFRCLSHLMEEELSSLKSNLQYFQPRMMLFSGIICSNKEMEIQILDMLPVQFLLESSGFQTNGFTRKETNSVAHVV